MSMAPTLPLIIAGVLFTLLGVPLAAQMVPPNRFYGFRIPSTLASADLWYRVNRATGIDLVVAGMLILALALFMFTVPRPVPLLGNKLAAAVVLLAVTAAITAHGLWIANST
jgi:uncharacterized membrane protein